MVASKTLTTKLNCEIGVTMLASPNLKAIRNETVPVKSVAPVDNPYIHPKREKRGPTKQNLPLISASPGDQEDISAHGFINPGFQRGLGNI
jgi:hypothetical protein